MSEMTVSAALRRIKKLKGMIAERTLRAKAAASYDETKVPAFAFAAAVDEREKLVRDLIAHQSAVAVSNATTKLPSGMPVASAVRMLDEIKGSIQFYKELNVRAHEKEVDVEEEFDWNPSMTQKVRVERRKTWISSITQVQRAERVDSLTSKFEVLNNEVEVSNNRTTVDVGTL